MFGQGSPGNEVAQRWPTPAGWQSNTTGYVSKLSAPANNKAGKEIPGRDYEFKEGKTIREHHGHSYPDNPTQNRGNHFNDSKENHYDYSK